MGARGRYHWAETGQWRRSGARAGAAGLRRGGVARSTCGAARGRVARALSPPVPPPTRRCAGAAAAQSRRAELGSGAVEAAAGGGALIPPSCSTDSSERRPLPNLCSLEAPEELPRRGRVCLWARAEGVLRPTDVVCGESRDRPLPVMENTVSVSSRHSVYSAESATSEEEEEERELEVFLSDSGSDVEKETGPSQHQRDAYSDRQALLFSPGAGRTSPGLVCQDRKCRTRKPLGLLASARLRPAGPCRRPPTVLGGAYCMHLVDAGGSLPRQSASQTRTKGGGRKRLMSGAVAGGQGHTTHVPQPPLRGGKKPRNEEPAAPGDPHVLCWPEGDLLFARKCRELQGFVQPLIELLNRLKMGRFAQGLSSFQQSVAMDRIQRIIGVLQKPEMGGRYLGTLLQVERMLKLWFPRVALKNSCADCGAAAETAEERDKPSVEENLARKWAVSTPGSVQSPPREKPLVSPASPDIAPGTPWAEPAPSLADWPAMNLTWIHTAPISNPPLGQADFSQMGSPIKQALLGPSMSAYGVVVFFQNNLASLGPYDHTAPLASVHASPASCHSNTPLLGSAEHPRCRSVPGPTVAGSQLPRGTLDRFSRSLPRLPTSSEERQNTGSGTAPYSSSS